MMYHTINQAKGVAFTYGERKQVYFPLSTLIFVDKVFDVIVTCLIFCTFVY